MTDVARTNPGTADAIDPVCGMKVSPGETKRVALYQGHSYWFCADGCRAAFEANPKKYLGDKKRKGWFGRYIDRLRKANEQEFGASGPKCH
jgi:YHS domain-containing protein